MSNVFIAVESIYSMDGDVAPLQMIVNTVTEIIGTERGHIVVDEAHSTGVLGLEGRGLHWLAMELYFSALKHFVITWSTTLVL
ncbi:hypothetical protein N0V86_004914 [Didymella sp. IMI 355093]|nr:hypothetical protein N0V86_004914 [Didymella sp. IMI 355093]